MVTAEFLIFLVEVV